MTAVVVSDPDQACRRFTTAALRHGGFGVTSASTADQALLILRRRPVKAMVIDPTGSDGVEALAAIRLRTEIPVIVVSRLTDECDKVAMLDAGADDYLVKPFGSEELLARLRVALRRSVQPADDPPVETPDFVIDFGARRFFRRDGSERTRRTTCAPTWPPSAASLSPIPPTPVTSSRRRAWA